MTAQGKRLFLQFALAFQVISEKFPLPGILLDVCLHFVGVDELEGIAVLQIIVPLVKVRNLIIMQDKVCEYPTIPVTDETADYEKSLSPK